MEQLNDTQFKQFIACQVQVLQNIIIDHYQLTPNSFKNRKLSTYSTSSKYLLEQLDNLKSVIRTVDVDDVDMDDMDDMDNVEEEREIDRLSMEKLLYKHKS